METFFRWFDELRQDLSYARRSLRRSPGFTVTVIVTLAMGVGLNAALFAFLDRVLLQAPAAVKSAPGLRRLYTDQGRSSEPNGRLVSDNFKYPQFRRIADSDPTLRIAAFTEPDSTVVVQGDVQIPVRRSRVTAEYFAILGIRARLGRFFVDEERAIETPTRVVVLSEAFWRRAYGGSESVVGRTLLINYLPFTVVGVAERGFAGVDLSAVDVWVPANTYAVSGLDLPWYETFRNRFQIIARVASPEDEVRLTTIATNAVRSVRLRGYTFDSTSRVIAGPIVRAAGPAPWQQELSISTRLAAVALVVLGAALANITNLQLVRATARRREIAVRRALGVARLRLLRQLLTESVLLALMGGVAALVVAYWSADGVRRLLLPEVHWSDSALGVRAVVFVAGTCLCVGLLAGVISALSATRLELTASLKSSDQGVVPDSKLRSTLLVAQAAVTIMLLVGAAIFVRSLRNVDDIDLGFDRHHTFYGYPLFAITPPDANDVGAGLEEIAAKLKGMGGIEAVAYAQAAPMAGYGANAVFLPDRDSLPRLGRERRPSEVAVSPGYFRATGMRMVSGRDFTSAEQRDDSHTLVVNESMARTYWPGRTAVGQCLIVGKRANPCSTVVGVVSDVHRLFVIEAPVLQYYVPITPSSRTSAATLIFRVATKQTAQTAKLVADEMRRRFPLMTSARITSSEQALETQFRPWRLSASLFSLFGLLALAVAAVGVYSTVAFVVSQRMHEMGVRIALGARAAIILDLVVGESMKTLGVGIIVGAAISFFLGQLVSSLLFGVTARDPAAFLLAGVVLTSAGLLASLFPAWRAANADPVRTLRAE
jgi:predicted permease